MPFVDVVSFLIILVGATNLMVGVLLYRRKPSDRLTQLFALLAFAVACWAFSTAAFRLVDVQIFPLIARLPYAFPVAIPPVFLFIALLFPPAQDISRVLAVFVTVVIAVISGVVLATPLVVVDVVISDSIRLTYFGSGYPAFAVGLIAVFSAGFSVLLRKYIAATGLARVQLRDLIVGTGVPIAVGAVVTLVLPWFGDYRFYTWLGQLTTSVFVLVLFYAIARHRLLEIRLLTAELLVAVLVLALAMRVFLSPTPGEVIVNVVILGLVGMISWGLVRGVHREAREKDQIRQLAADREETNQRLRSLDQAKSEFVSIASHQLRAPLAVIKGYLSLLREGTAGALPAAAHHAVDTAASVTERMIRIVEDLLNLSRIEAGKLLYTFNEADLARLTAGVVAEFQPKALARQITLAFSHDGSSAVLLIDENRLREVITNLVDNAIKYSPAGARVDVRLREISEGRQRSLRLSVTDQGIGIQPSDLPRLFGKFARGEAARAADPAGMGIGLYFARRIVEDHGGRIWVESPGFGQGSAFHVEIPLAPTKPPPTAKA